MGCKKRRKNLVVRDLFGETPDVLEYNSRIYDAIKTFNKIKIGLCAIVKFVWGIKHFCSLQLALRA